MEVETPHTPKPDIFQFVQFTFKLEQLFTKERNETDHLRLQNIQKIKIITRKTKGFLCSFFLNK